MISSLPSCLSNLNLKGLNCQGSPLLTTLPDLPRCTHLNCSGCPLLTAIPALPSCTTLNCSGCPLLTSLPALPGCTHLYCSNCWLLSVLPELPSCRHLNCSNCWLLSGLPELPRCTELYCYDCPLLAVLPTLHPSARVVSQGCPLLSLEVREVPPNDWEPFHISWKDLNENPLKVLKALLPFLREGPFPNIVFLNEDGTPQEGSDVGGLGRHLISQLFAQLSKLGCIPKNPGTELLRPTAPTAATPAEKEILEALGLLFVSAAHRKLPIGQIFDLAFFTDLQAFSGQNLGEYKEAPQAWIKKQCSESSPHIATSINTWQTLELLKQTFSEYPIPAELDLEEAKLFILNTYIESTVQVRSPWYEAAYLISSAMQGQRGWHSLSSLSVDALQASIEGAFSKEAFKRAIHWQGTADVSTKAYLLKWIETQNEEKVKDLLQFSTGSLSLTGEPFIVTISPPARQGTFPLPTSHTCVRQLCLPTGYSSQQMFDDKIKQSLEDAKANGFLFV